MGGNNDNDGNSGNEKENNAIIVMVMTVQVAMGKSNMTLIEVAMEKKTMQ